MKQLTKTINRIFQAESIHLFIGSSEVYNLVQQQVPAFEFGFPSFLTHRLYSRPFLGFSGALAFIESMANTIRRNDRKQQDIIKKYKRGTEYL